MVDSASGDKGAAVVAGDVNSVTVCVVVDDVHAVAVVLMMFLLLLLY